MSAQREITKIIKRGISEIFIKNAEIIYNIRFEVGDNVWYVCNAVTPGLFETRQKDFIGVPCMFFPTIKCKGMSLTFYPVPDNDYKLSIIYGLKNE